MKFLKDKYGNVSTDKIKVEDLSCLEIIVGFFVLVSIVLTLYLVKEGYGIRDGELIASMASIFIFRWILSQIDEFYVLDAKHQAIMYSSKIFSKKKYECYLAFNKIDAIVTSGKFVPATKQGKYSKEKEAYWNYETIFVLTDGTTMDFGTQDTDFEKVDKQSKAFAKIIGTSFVQNKPEYKAIPTKSGEHYTFDFEKAENKPDIPE